MQDQTEPSAPHHRDDRQSPPSQSLADWYDVVTEQLTGLRQLFEDKIREDAARGDLFEKLYRDLAKYRDDFLFNHVIRQVLVDLVGLFDRVDGLIRDAAPERRQEIDPIAYIASFRTEILQVLRRREVQLIENGTKAFDDNVQEAVDSAPVARHEDDQKVVAVVRRGFRYRDRVLRPEGVVVGIFDAKRESEDGQSNRD
jgi:molecular chaperone GrpE (heat shock protein)